MRARKSVWKKRPVALVTIEFVNCNMYTENQHLQRSLSPTRVQKLGTYLNVVIRAVCISNGADIFLRYS